MSIQPDPTCPCDFCGPRRWLARVEARRAAIALTTAADAIREATSAHDAVDAYFSDRDLDIDAEDVARALTEAANKLRVGEQ